MVIKGADGNYKYGSNVHKDLTIREEPPLKEDQDERASLMDEELQFILENFEFSPEISEELLNDYFKHRRLFFILMTMQFFIQIYVMTMTWAERETIFFRMN